MGDFETVVVTVLVTLAVVAAVRLFFEWRRYQRAKKVMRARREYIRKLLASLALPRMEVVKPAEIRRGDHVCWTSVDEGRHEHYEAGFNGDSGPSESGVHARPIVQRSQS